MAGTTEWPSVDRQDHGDLVSEMLLVGTQVAAFQIICKGLVDLFFYL